MAKKRVVTRKTHGAAGAAEVRQDAAGRGAAKGSVSGRVSATEKQLSALEKRTLELYRETPLSIREIGRRVGKDDSFVRRLVAREGAERGDAQEIAARLEAAQQRAIAETQAGTAIASAERVGEVYIQATTAVLNTQRSDQRAARLAVAKLLARVNDAVAVLPEVAEAIAGIKAAAIGAGDVPVLRSLQALDVSELAKTARQLVAALRDLDAIERVAHGIKAGEGGECPAAGKARVAVVPAKAARPPDDD